MDTYDELMRAMYREAARQRTRRESRTVRPPWATDPHPHIKWLTHAEIIERVIAVTFLEQDQDYNDFLPEFAEAMCSTDVTVMRIKFFRLSTRCKSLVTFCNEFVHQYDLLLRENTKAGMNQHNITIYNPLNYIGTQWATCQTITSKIN